jgi:outer membrane protein TolC
VGKTARTLAAAGFVLVAAMPSSAQDSANIEHVRALIARAMNQQGGQPPIGPPVIQETGPVIRLSVDDAVARAMDRNLTIASERLTPQTWDLSIAATLANYRPNLTSSFSNNSQARLTTDIFSGAGVSGQVNTQTQAWSGGLAQNMRKGGGNYSVSWTNSRASTDSLSSTRNPAYDAGLAALFTQPLLRNFKIDNPRTALLTNRINQSLSEINLSATVASTVAAVRNAYWELVYAVQAVEAAERSLDLSSKLVQDNQSRVEIGTMAPIDVVQAQAEQATRRQTLVNAQATLRNNELALKRLIVSGTEDDLWRATIRPTELPAMSAAPVDLEGAVTNALANRTDIAITRKNLELSDVQMRSLVNQTLPDLNLIGSYNLQGLGGTLIDRDRLTGDIRNTIPGGYFDAIRSISGFDAPTWNVRLNFAYPLGTSAPKANLARQRILREQTAANLKATELQIAVDVTTAALAIRNAQESIQASQASRELSEKRLEAVQSKMDVGMATNYEVVQAQRDLADARNSELRAQLNYQRALVDFQRAQISPR